MSDSHEQSKDRELVEHPSFNTGRYFVNQRHVAWVLLALTVLWGLFAYARMPKAKDPLIAVRVAAATCTWPGAPAEKIEQLVTRKIEQKISENANIEKVESMTRDSIAVITVTLNENVKNVGLEFDDVKLKLDSINDLPQGAGPINFIKDFGDTAALMLTVASPKVSEIELELRAESVRQAIESARAQAPAGARRTFALEFPATMNAAPLRRTALAGARQIVESRTASDARVIERPGFIGIDLSSDLPDDKLLAYILAFGQTRLRISELHPDVWRPVLIHQPQETQERLASVEGDRYSYRELDDFTDQIQRYLQSVELVSKVTRSGVLPEAVYLDYSQERLASYGLQQSALSDVLAGRNITVPGGLLEISGKNVSIDPSGELRSERELADIVVGMSTNAVPTYLRDLVEISRAYQAPPRYLNYLTRRDGSGRFTRTRAITLAVQMRPGQQIAHFGAAVEARLAEVKKLLPEDLILVRTSDQPLQVSENVGLFMDSLYEAIALVVLVALVGFWEWRSALLLALSIPITLAMTFGFMQLLGLDVQQISIASLILALGLLVDDPVVAGDAIKNALGRGWKPLVAAWLGPSRLATAILFATITNIAAYLPLLTLSGDVGKFIFSLPVVIACSLVASRIVSMTFIPLLGFYLLRPGKSAGDHRAPGGFPAFYRRVVGFCIDHRLIVFGASVALLVFAFAFAGRLKTAFFPQDLSYLSYVDVWLPEDTPLSTTREKAFEATAIVEEAAAQFGKDHPDKDGKPRPVLESVTTFVGGGGPRFWFSVTPELQQLNYAQLVIQVQDKHDTPHLIPVLQAALSSRLAGARLDVRPLENGKPVGVPVSVRIAGEDLEQLRAFAEEAKAILRRLPILDRVRDDWGAQTFAVKLEVDPDRANMAGFTNLDVALSSAVAMNGRIVSALREGDKQIPIIARLRAEERAQLEDIESLYVSSQRGPQKIPLGQVSRISYDLETAKIRRRNQFRTVTVAGFPVAGVLASEVIKLARPELDKLAQRLPPGMSLAIGGEQEEQEKGFANLAVALLLTVVGIFLALVIQFRNAVKPLVVYAAIPYGVAGALVSLTVMGAPFGFMAFLGIVSLIGVIVSHVIVLFDFIEEMHEKGEPLREALLDAGILRLRPVLITVAATVLGLFPLALHGGPLWEPLCYAQIGGLTVATFLTLLLVPVIYTIFVRDLKLISWEKRAEQPEH